jgi:hypothetical protein
MKQESRPDCLSLEQLSSLMEGRVEHQAHVDSCVFCQAELKMMMEFESGVVEASERKDVAAIVAGLRPKPAVRESWFSMPMLPRLVGAFAAVLLVAAIGMQMQSMRPVDGVDGSAVVRSGGEIRIAPQGDLATVPVEWKWAPVDGAVRYEVKVTEVDGTLLTRVEVTTPSVPLPGEVRAAMLPKRTILLSVRAFDAGGRVVAEATEVKVRLEPEIGLKVK